MNIFYLSQDPVESARAHLDKHVVKMILEYAQLLSTAHRLIDGNEKVVLSNSGRKKKVWQLNDDRDSILYAATHANHPSAIWARKSSENYMWLYNLFVATCDEYTYRYGKVHLTDTKLRHILSKQPNNIAIAKWQPPTPAMPDECKVVSDELASYKRYYIDKKADMAKWTNREPPQWFIQGIKEKDAYIRFSVQELRELFRKDTQNVGKRQSNKRTLSKVSRRNISNNGNSWASV
jgi:hypothetical protein